MGTLEDIADFQTGYPFPSEKYVRSGDSIRLCRGANVLPARMDWSDVVWWPKSRAQEFAQFKLEAGDTVIAMDRPWTGQGFKAAQIDAEDLPALLLQRVARLRPKPGISGVFLYNLVRHPAFTRHCRPTETTVPHMSPHDIKSFKFVIPPTAAQLEYSKRVTSVGRIKQNCHASLTQLDALFASVQHRAFRGEL
jgi:type I restriction enzyme, S subunit